MGNRTGEVKLTINHIEDNAVWFIAETRDDEFVATTHEYGPYLVGESMLLKLAVAVNPTLVIIEERGG